MLLGPNSAAQERSILGPREYTMRTLPFVYSALLGGLFSGCGDSGAGSGTSDGACMLGHEGCACADGGQCLAGLICVADRCEPQETTEGPTESDTEVATAGSQSGSASASSGKTTTGDETATATSGTGASVGTSTDTSTETGTTEGGTTKGGTTEGGTTEGGTTAGGTDTEGTTGGLICGDGIGGADEECDGADLKEGSCVDLGFKGGKLGCTDECGYDTGECTNSEACGDGLIVPGVLCYKPVESLGSRSAAMLNRGDLNEDGHLDLLVSGGGGLAIYFGDGNVPLGPPVVFPDLLHNVRLVVDVDKDGHLDVIGEHLGHKDAHVSLGDGQGGLVAGPVYDTFDDVRSMAVGDLNADGWYDLGVAFQTTTKITIRLGKPGGAFGPAVSYDKAPLAIDNLGFADMDVDGSVDVWALTQQGDYLLYPGDGSGSLAFDGTQGPLASSNSDFAAVGHFNDDIYPDIAGLRNTGAGSLQVRLGGMGGLVEMIYSYPIDGSYPRSGVEGNFDGNEILDIAGLSWDGTALDVFRGDGTGLFYDGVDLAPGLGGRRLTAGDFNEDGVDDLVTAHSNNSIKIALSHP